MPRINRRLLPAVVLSLAVRYAITQIVVCIAYSPNEIKIQKEQQKVEFFSQTLTQ